MQKKTILTFYNLHMGVRFLTCAHIRQASPEQAGQSFKFYPINKANGKGVTAAVTPSLPESCSSGVVQPSLSQCGAPGHAFL